MIIKNISIQNFRNWAKADLEFSRKGNIFFGKNGHGKTNLLEAIAYVQSGKSFRGIPDRQLIKFEESFFDIRSDVLEIVSIGEAEEFEKEVSLSASFKLRVGKAININRQKVKKLSQLIGILNFVILSLEDRKITQGNPADRRKFMDQSISQVIAAYLGNLQDARRLLHEKITAIRNEKFGEDVITVINQKLAELFSQIMEKRAIFIERLNPYFAEFYSLLNDGDEKTGLEYRHALKSFDAKEIFEFMQENRKKEIKTQAILYGAQRDDLKVTINGNDSRFFASQGQHKSLIVAMKISLSKYYQEFFNRKPILLLDDIFSELDNFRARSMVNLFRFFSQVFVTVPREDELALLPEDFKVFEIQEGKLAGD